MLHIDQLYENILYLNQKNIRTYDALLTREAKVIEKEKALKNQKYSTDFLQEDEIYLRYQQLREKLKKIPDSDDEFEKVLDELEELECHLPDAVLNKKEGEENIEEELQYIRKEKKIINRIKREEERVPFFYHSMELRSSRGRKDTSLICHNMKKKEDIMMWFMQQENLCKKK